VRLECLRGPDVSGRPCGHLTKNRLPQHLDHYSQAPLSFSTDI